MASFRAPGVGGYRSMVQFLAEREKAQQEQMLMDLRQQEQARLDRATEADIAQGQQGLDLQAGRDREARNRAGVQDMERQAGLMAVEQEQQQATEAQARQRAVLQRYYEAEQDPETRRTLELMMEGFNPQSIRAAFPEGQEAAGFTLNPGQIRYDAQNRVVARGRDPVGSQDAAGFDAYGQGQTEQVFRSIDELSGQVGPSTVGVGGLTAALPGTPARSFANQLNTLRANIGFRSLQAMRNASQTGGALGQVSEKENTLLQSTLAGFDQLVRPEDFRAQLAKAREVLQRQIDIEALALSGNPQAIQAYVSDYRAAIQRGGQPPDPRAYITAQTPAGPGRGAGPGTGGGMAPADPLGLR